MERLNKIVIAAVIHSDNEQLFLVEIIRDFFDGNDKDLQKQEWIKMNAPIGFLVPKQIGPIFGEYIQLSVTHRNELGQLECNSGDIIDYRRISSYKGSFSRNK
jgi:hypothetical protein